MVELAGAGGYRYAAASMHGPGLNPWNTDHWSGGSSSGPGSAVAAGLVPFAIGSETWGSITTPSSYCGITGLRPTYGLVSRHGAMPLSWTMDKLGPMCRSAVDCALVLEAIAGNDPQDPSSSGRDFHYRSQTKPALDTLRVGFSDIDFRHWAHPASRPGFQDALDVFREMKLKFKPISLPQLPYGDAAEIIISAEGSSVFEPLIRGDKLETLADERQKAGLRAGLAIPASEYLRAMRIRRIVQEKLRRLFAHVDLIVSPTTPETASRLDAPLDAGRPLKLPDGERRKHRLIRGEQPRRLTRPLPAMWLRSQSPANWDPARCAPPRRAHAAPNRRRISETYRLAPPQTADLIPGSNTPKATLHVGDQSYDMMRP